MTNPSAFKELRDLESSVNLPFSDVFHRFSALCTLVAFWLKISGSLEVLFPPAFRDLELLQSQNNCAVFCFLLYKADSLEEMVRTALKGTLCAPFSGPADLAKGPKPALGSKFSLEAQEMTICLCVIPCGKKVHFIG